LLKSTSTRGSRLLLVCLNIVLGMFWLALFDIGLWMVLGKDRKAARLTQ
jgi:hypothetical protein